jgi:AcrR family transcriptional regulator
MPEQTRKQILATSLELFMAQGYEATTVDGIAEAAGVTKPTVYYHFESKEDLFHALFLSMWDQVGSMYLGLISEAPDVRTALEAAFAAMGEISEAFAGDGAGVDVNMMSLVIDGARRFPEIRAEVRTLYEDFQEIIAAKIDEGIEAGEVRGDVDSRAVALFLVGLMEGVLLVESLTEMSGFQGREAQAVDLIWNGLARRTGMMA